MATTQKEPKSPNLITLIKSKLPKGSGKVRANHDHASLWGKIGFTLGLVSIFAWFMPILGIAVSVAGLVLNILGLKVEKGRWFAVVGLTLSIVFLNLSFIYGFYSVLISMLGGTGI